MVMIKYSLLQTVVETCQKKKRCKINSRPHHSQSYSQVTGSSSLYGSTNDGFSSYSSSSISNTSNHFNNIPCPERTRLVEVAYKCRPCKYCAEFSLFMFKCVLSI